MWQRPVLGDVVQLIPTTFGISARYPDGRIKAAVIKVNIGKTDCVRGTCRVHEFEHTLPAGKPLTLLATPEPEAKAG